MFTSTTDIFTSFPAIIYYRILKRRLKMTLIETKLTRKQIGELTGIICKALNWHKEKNRKNLIVLKTPEEFWSFVAAEQITILFVENGILVNSIRNLDAQRKAFGEVGNNAKNIIILKRMIEMAEGKLLQ